MFFCFKLIFFLFLDYINILILKMIFEKNNIILIIKNIFLKNSNHTYLCGIKRTLLSNLSTCCSKPTPSPPARVNYVARCLPHLKWDGQIHMRRIFWWLISFKYNAVQVSSVPAAFLLLAWAERGPHTHFVFCLLIQSSLLAQTSSSESHGRFVWI